MSRDSLGECIVDETLRFTLSALDASAVVLTWIGNNYDAVSTAGIIGISDFYLRDYNRVEETDPLGIPCFVANSWDVACLSGLEETAPTERRLWDYKAFLKHHGFGDEMDFLIASEGAPVAMLSLFTQGGACFSKPAIDLHALHRYVQHHLGLHPRLREFRSRILLRQRFGLSPREIDVIYLIGSGATNAEISEMLGISLATVKSHVINILNKLGVDNRVQAIALANLV